MVIYAATVALSACLLFLIQPLITKMIFPWFGGTSGIWVVALLFFQICLLGGYLYAHWLIQKCRPHTQWIVHAIVLLTASALLPIIPSDQWRPDAVDAPAFHILLLLAATVGLPCFALSATSPLLQAWFVRERGTSIPLWLFALSNAGSLIALLSFPLLLEPAVDTHTIAYAWSASFVAFAALCGWIAWKHRNDAPAVPAQAAGAGAPPVAEQLFWVALAACGSGLLAACTVQLTANIAPIPLLWVVPLAVYLLTFILAFGRRRIYRRERFFPLIAGAIACVAWLYTHSESHQEITYVIPLYLACLFVLCLACHGELALRAPPARHLTLFYLLIAAGGALGGLFVSVIAPLVFESHLELPVLLVVLAELMIVAQWKRRGAGAMLWPLRVVMILAVLMLASSLAFFETRIREESETIRRNFYGVLQVRDFEEHGSMRRSLVHGTIRHGFQFTEPGSRELATSYYAPSSGVARAILAKQSTGPVRVGVVGLGVGTLLSYARANDEFSVYEINPDVVDLAHTQFTYLALAAERGANVPMKLGDARLSLEAEAPQRFDVLAIDAFSSDAIPVHLLTREAFALYMRHLNVGGVLAVHISNRYLNLAPVCARAAEHLNLSARLIHAPAGEAADTSYWVLISAEPDLWTNPNFSGAEPEVLQPQPGFAGWTDRYSSLWPVLRLSARGIASATP